jgi:antitoxin ParD1/3/4
MASRIDIPIAHPSYIPMNILLTLDQTDFVQTQIESGQCSSPEEVIAIALEMMAHSQEAHDPVWLEETRIKVQVGLDDIARGDVLDGEMAIERLQQRLAQKRAQSL